MSINDINNDPVLKAKWVKKIKERETLYYSDHPESLIPLFEKELREQGFVFEISNQALGFMPKYKKEILPIAIKYYKLSKQKQLSNEQDYFLNFFHFKGFDEVVPQLLEDYYSSDTNFQ